MDDEARLPFSATARLCLVTMLAGCVLAAAPAPAPKGSAPATSKGTTASRSTTAQPKTAPPKTSSAPTARTATFSFVCATPAVLLPPPVKQIVTQLTRAHKAGGARPWGDRAVSLRLRKDHAPVYFVPLTCGTTGNCTWGVVDSSPAKSLGVFAGAVVQVETTGSGWPPIQVFTSGAGGDTRLETLKLMDGQYRAQASSGKPAASTVAQLQSCLDNASCCPRLGGAP
ncbi:MAG TPA: hypothetical protein VGS03_10405 [Candidatus Polarisedimenticolia bacterium]|nr:hypothetical protein [Candidatus Polarisedimenticolia bacterium]